VEMRVVAHCSSRLVVLAQGRCSSAMSGGGGSRVLVSLIGEVRWILLQL
jgi:hypothetical protein